MLLDDAARIRHGFYMNLSSFPAFLKRFWPLALLVIGALGFYASGLSDVFSYEALIESRLQLQTYVGENFQKAMLIYAASYILVTALSLPGGTLMTLLGGWLFGGWIGGSLAIIAATMGAILVFTAARTAFADILGNLLKRKGGKNIQKLQEGIREDALFYMLFLRLVPVFPFWLVNLAPALLGVSFAIFSITTLIGIMPAAFAFAFAGSGLENVLETQGAALAACRASGQVDCTVSFDPRYLAIPELLIGLGIIGLTALIPIILKRFSFFKRRA